MRKPEPADSDINSGSEVMQSSQNGTTESQSVLKTTLLECKSVFWTVAVFSFVINALMLATPLYMLQVMDRVLRSGKVETLLLLTLIATAAVLIMSVLDTLRGSIAMRTGSWINEKLGPVYLESSCRAQVRGDYASTETLRDLNYLQGFVATQGMAAFFDSPWVPIFVVCIWYLHPYLGMIALGSAFLLLLISFFTEWMTHEPNQTAEETEIEIMRLADITIRNAEVVQSMGMMPVLAERWRKLNGAATAATHAAGDASGYALTVSKFLRAFVQIAILGMGAWLVVDNLITPGAMIAAAILLGRALAPVETAIAGWTSFVSARLAYKRLKEHIEEYPPERRRTLLPNPVGQLTVENVSYSVPDAGHTILKDVSFHAMPGEVLAIVGPSGAGKSTLCRLLVGLNEPSAGRIRLDDSNIQHWDRQQLGALVGYLPQDVELFPGTLHENISRMRPARDDEVVAAARLAHVHEMIQRLPMSYETLIGNGGVRLSGGQRQRVGLARAVFGRPHLVVLDEPNANLDQAGEAALAKSLRDLKARGSVVVVVGHRPSTLAQADKLLVLQNGSVALFGPRDEVLEAWSEAVANEGGVDTLPLRRPPSAQHALKPPEANAEAGAT
jgi:ATP-binding cassette subfamily C protein/ATP-binding cassette subfamily C exporter for protease/lipase/ATP-binding cassette subfamily C protein EexD